MTTSKINWSVGVMEYWNDGLRAPNTHYSVIPTLHHPILLISSFAPFHPSFRRSDGGVEQRPLGHGADHGAAVFGGGAHVADWLGFLGGNSSDLFCQLFGENLSFESRFGALGADRRRRDCAKHDANAVTLLVFFAQIVGNRDADVSEVHHLAGRKLDIFADESRTGFRYRDFREDFLSAHHGLPRSFKKFFQIN